MRLAWLKKCQIYLEASLLQTVLPKWSRKTNKSVLLELSEGYFSSKIQKMMTIFISIKLTKLKENTLKKSKTFLKKSLI
jgi:hypothetical protein